LDRLEKHEFGKRLAIVIPFTSQDIPGLLLKNIARWPQHSCMSSRQYGKFIDLILYYNRDLSDLPSHQLNAIKQALAVYEHQHCFNAVRFMHARLNATEDQYPIGPSNMFFRLFHLDRFTQQFHTMFLMEPDVIPCRSHWVDRVYEESALDTEYWLKGSILRDTETQPEYQGYTFSGHINGNAWYRVGDPGLREFITGIVEPEFRRDPAQYLYSWDIAVDLVLRNRNLVGWSRYVSIRHRFRHSAVIQNYYRGHYNASAICAINSETFLVHGRNLFT
jgi:hypothetical protein